MSRAPVHDLSVLDEAFERLDASGFELPNGFINHAPMACEALVALDLDSYVAPWAARARQGAAVEPVVAPRFEPQDVLGDIGKLPEWIGYFSQAIDGEGWPTVVEVWVPRLLPSLAVALFHGAIRAGHAVRAIDAADTAPRRAELARALGYWAARFQPGATARPVTAEPIGDLRTAVVTTAADGAARYLARPGILELHGVTGAMAVELFVGHIPTTAAEAGLRQIRAEHDHLYRGVRPVTAYDPAGASDEALGQAAATSRDPHQVKLVEACRRGMALTGDPAFAAAAETVTGLG